MGNDRNCWSWNCILLKRNKTGTCWPKKLSKKIKVFDEKKNILGTGGGILNIIKSSKDKNYLVLNPDTIWNEKYLSEIENELKFSPFISDAVVIGDKRKFLSCLIMIDEENVMKHAQDNDIPFSNFESLCKSEEIVSLIDDEVNKVNKKFASVEQVKKFSLIDIQLTAEDDELTPTMKLKRKFINQKYGDIIESMYQSA